MTTLQTLRVLLLEDHPEDAELILNELRQAGFDPDWQRVDTEDEYLTHLDADLDLILADFSISRLKVAHALDLLQERGLDIPVIILTGSFTEQIIIETLQKGVVDYLLKDRLARLGQSVSQALSEKRLRDEKRQAEKALKDSESRLRLFNENAQDVIYRYRMSPTQEMEYVNPAITAITGYPAADFYAQPALFYKLVFNEDEGLLTQLLRPEQNMNRHVDLRWVHKDGSIIWTEHRNVLVFDQAGELVAVEGIIRDITKRKRAEQALRESEASFRHLFANNPLPMWVYDLDTLAFLDVNEAAVTHYGYSREEFLGLRLVDIRPPEDVPQSLDHFAQRDPTLYNAHETRHRLKDGQIIDVDLSSHVIDFDGRKAVLVVSQDITTRKHAEQALQASEERFRLLFEQSPVAISITRDNTRLYDNQAFAHLFGYADSLEALAMPLHDELAANNGLQTAERVPHELEHVVSVSGEFVGKHKDGTLFPIYAQVGEIQLLDGMAQVNFLTDLTERNRLETEARENERLRIELDEEKEINQLKERFTSMVSHEFRTPLTVILTASDLLDAYHDRLTPEKRTKYVRSIQEQIKLLIQLLDDVLDLSIAQSGKLDCVPKPMDIGDLCRDIFEQLQFSDVGVHQFSFTNRFPYKEVNLDEHLLRHILFNLLSNALKYTPEAGEVRFELSGEEHVVIFQISDRGIGIPESDLSHLFEPFHRGRNARHVEGTGLGLTIVKNNVEAHGGTITIESHEGIGTTFTVTIPMPLYAR